MSDREDWRHGWRRIGMEVFFKKKLPRQPRGAGPAK